MMRGWVIAAGLALISPMALAQAPPAARDQVYCERLFDSFERYVVRLRRHGSPMRDVMAEVAIDRCRHGRIAEGIPILEAKLQGARVPLPDR